MTEEAMKALLDANVRLTEQLVQLATAVIEAKAGVVVAGQAPALPSFQEFASQDLSPEEKLFYSEEEEDAKFEAELFGSGPGTDPETLKEILQAAGLEPDLSKTP